VESLETPLILLGFISPQMMSQDEADDKHILQTPMFGYESYKKGKKLAWQDPCIRVQ
jgi:hypothetical protein